MACIVATFPALGQDGPAPLGAATLQAQSLCKSEESVYFSCQLRKSRKQVSLCGSSDLSLPNAFLTYRFGTPTLIELSVPDDPKGSLGYFGFGAYVRARVTKWAVGFHRQGFWYTLFDDYDGESAPPVVNRGVKIQSAAAGAKPRVLDCGAAATSKLGTLGSVIKCDENLTFGGCKAK